MSAIAFDYLLVVSLKAGMVLMVVVPLCLVVIGGLLLAAIVVIKRQRRYDHKNLDKKVRKTFRILRILSIMLETIGGFF